jgi:uncharacterized membrane protein
MDLAVLKIFFLAMAPIGELRVALPVALTHYELPLLTAYVVSVLGNFIPVVFIVYLLDPVQKFLSKHSRFFKWFFKKLFERTRRKHTKKFETFEEVALITFVAIPLPVTGAWSGALAAFVFGISPKKSIPLIFIGILISGVIVTALTYGVTALGSSLVN